MKKYAVLFSFFAVAYIANIKALPAQVILIRHAEKSHQGNSLSLKGRERAAALAPYFMEDPDVTVYGPPAAIYAQAADKPDSSLRPIETVTPLAQTLKLAIKNQFGKDDLAKMVEEIKTDPSYYGKMVLISWEHSSLPELARALGATQSPARWNGDTYDRVWIIGFHPGSKVSFRNVSQKLMYRDSPD